MTGFVERWWTSSDGLRLHARDYAGAGGEARLPVVGLHGLTRNARDFEEVAPRIAAAGRRVLALDARGRGLSAWDPEPARYVPLTYARDVAELLARLGIGRAAFVGTSMGGLVTMALAATAPGLVASAVVNDVGPELAPEGLARIGSYTGEGAAAEDWGAAAAQARRMNGVAFPDLDAEGWDRFARRLFREADGRPVLDYDPAIAGPVRAGGAAPAPDMWPLWRALTAGRPVLLVRGALSDLLAADTAARMGEGARDFTRADVPRVGHAPMLTEPVAQAALDAFLARVD